MKIPNNSVNRMPQYVFLRVACFVSMALLCALSAMAQNDKAVRKDSVSVSAGISKKQLAQEDRLNASISRADQTLKMGNTDDAIKQYESALAMVRKESLLGEQEQRVLTKLGYGYIQANRAADAVPVFSRLLEFVKKDCEPDSQTLSTCADAQKAFAFAKMRAGDFADGLTSLQQAEANYAKAETGSTVLHEFAMIQVMKQAETKVLSAVALSRLGRSADAVAAIDAAIPQLTRVLEDKSINVGIRDSAAASLKDAQSVQLRLKSAP